MCKYKIMFPIEAGDFDQISIEITVADRVTIYAAETETYSNPSGKEFKLSQGDTHTVTFPNSIYLSIVSNPVQSAADFVISYRFNDRNPSEVLETLSEEERDKYLSRKVIVKQQKIYQDWTFWVLIAGGLFGVIIMVILCVCLVNMKQRNDEITSKVVLMA